MQYLQYFAIIAMIFCSICWMGASIFCLRTYFNLTKLFGFLNDEMVSMKESIHELESRTKGIHKTIMNHNDRIDKMTSQIVRLMNEKELHNVKDN